MFVKDLVYNCMFTEVLFMIHCVTLYNCMVVGVCSGSSVSAYQRVACVEGAVGEAGRRVQTGAAVKSSQKYGYTTPFSLPSTQLVTGIKHTFMFLQPPDCSSMKDNVSKSVVLTYLCLKQWKWSIETAVLWNMEQHSQVNRFWCFRGLDSSSVFVLNSGIFQMMWFHVPEDYW